MTHEQLVLHIQDLEGQFAAHSRILEALLMANPSAADHLRLHMEEYRAGMLAAALPDRVLVAIEAEMRHLLPSTPSEG